MQRNSTSIQQRDEKKYKPYQILAFLITALLYTSFHAARTAWAYSKKDIENDDYFNDRMLSFLDISFMLSYAAGLFYNGWLGDQINLKSFLTQGGLLSVFGFCFFCLSKLEKDAQHSDLLLTLCPFRIWSIKRISRKYGCFSELD